MNIDDLAKKLWDIVWKETVFGKPITAREHFRAELEKALADHLRQASAVEQDIVWLEITYADYKRSKDTACRLMRVQDMNPQHWRYFIAMQNPHPPSAAKVTGVWWDCPTGGSPQSDTPRTDAFFAPHRGCLPIDRSEAKQFCKTLERELAEAKNKIDEWERLWREKK